MKIICHAVLSIFCLEAMLRYAYSKRAPNIAVIGAGIGGGSAVHFLRSLFEEIGANIDVYESNQVGGRLALAKIGNKEYEIGGSVIHPRNEYMSEFARLLDLKHRKPPEGRLAIYDGKEYVFIESNWEIFTYFKLFWRYGSNLLKLHWLIDELMQHFSRIYSIQNQGHAFNSVETLLSAMNPAFVNMTQTTARKTLKQQKFSADFIDEFVMAVTRVNYGQTPDINAFVGTVALAGAESGLWSVKGGNKLVPQLLIQKANVNTISALVEKITLKGDTFNIKYDSSNGQELKNQESFNESDAKEVEEATYDLVIIATPLINELSDIKFEGFPKPIRNFDGNYHHTVCTLVRGDINATSLHMTVKLDAVLTTNETALFNSLSKIYPVDSEQQPHDPVWKIFSQKPLTNEELDSMFLKRIETHVTDWLAYPHYTPPDTLGSFILHPGLYYTSSIEWAASAMEMSAIAGRNAAILAYNHWFAIQGKLDTLPVTHLHNEL